MKKNYFTMIIDFSETSESIFLGGSGINIEFKLSSQERQALWESIISIENFETGNKLMEPLRPGENITSRLINSEMLPGNSIENLEQYWKLVNHFYLEPYRILLHHAGETEKQRKALRDFFKPVRFRLRSIQTLMEAENRTKIDVPFDNIV